MTYEQTQIADETENLGDWLGYAPKDIENLLVTMRRAYGAACVSEPVTAIVILPLIGDLERTRARVNELIALRGAK